jgi:hypothetical protein
MNNRMIDAYGDLRIDGQRSKARLIQVTQITYAAFSQDAPKTPTLITATGPARVQGRNVIIELIGGGLLEFRRAGCGCSTPSNLRSPRSKMLELVPAPADA